MHQDTMVAINNSFKSLVNIYAIASNPIKDI